MAETIVKRRIEEENKDPTEEVVLLRDSVDRVVLEKFENSQRSQGCLSEYDELSVDIDQELYRYLKDKIDPDDDKKKRKKKKNKN